MASKLKFLMLLTAAAALPLHAAEANPMPASAPAEEASYRLGPGDVLSIAVFGIKDFDQIVRVSNSGKIRVPHVGLVTVAGRTEIELQRELAKVLVERQIVKDPFVQLKIVQYRAHPVYILGEVLMPGQFVITDEMRVMDLLTLSGGVNTVANPVAYLYRRRNAGDPLPAKTAAPQTTFAAEMVTTPTQGITDEAIQIHLDELSSGRDPAINIKLQGGDVLYIPQKREETFFVVGDVLRSGGVTMPEGEKILASRALAMAGGVLKTAKMGKGMLVRTDSQGRREERPINFNAILRGKQPDFLIQPNDVIFIPGSTTKSIGYGLIGALPNVASDAATQ